MFSTAAAGLAFRLRQRVLYQEHRSAQVHLVGLSPTLRVSSRPSGWANAFRGVVHHDIDTAELVDGPLHEGTEVVDVAKVGGHPDGLAPETAPGCSAACSAGVGFAAGDHDASAGQHEAFCQRQFRFPWYRPSR